MGIGSLKSKMATIVAATISRQSNMQICFSHAVMSIFKMADN